MQKPNNFDSIDYTTYAEENKEELLRSAVAAIEPDAMGMDRNQALTLAGAMKNCGFDRDDFAAVMSRSSVDKGTFTKQWDNFRGSGHNGECTEGTIYKYAQLSGWRWPAPSKDTLAAAGSNQAKKKTVPAMVKTTDVDFKIRCIMDSVEYNQKPTPANAREIRNREQIPTPPPQGITLQDFVEAVTNGRTFSPAVYSKTMVKETNQKTGEIKEKGHYDVIEQQLFVVDIDNEEKVKDENNKPVKDENGKELKRRIKNPMTIAKAREICEANGLEPFLIYETFSSKIHRDDPAEPYKKFRLCFALDKPLTVQEVGEAGINKTVNYFINFFGEAADHSTTDPARLIYGTDEKQSAQLAPKTISKDKLFKKLFVEADKTEDAGEDQADQKEIIEIKPVGEYIDLFRHNREAYKNNIRTGFLALDKILGGGFGSELYVMPSETGSGKTAVASVLAQYIARNGVDVYYFCLEMGRDEFIARGASMISAERDLHNAIPYGEILGDTFDPRINDFYRRPYSQYEEYVQEYDRRYGKHLFVIECSTVGTTAKRMIEIVKKDRVNKQGRFMVFVDYLQLVTADPEDRTQRDKMTIMSGAVMAFKTLTSNPYGASVFLLSSMANDKAGKEIGEMSFKYSGDIGYTAGVSLAWTWEGVTNESDNDKRANEIARSNDRGYREMSFTTLKHRNGAKRGGARLRYYPAYNYIVESDATVQTRKPTSTLQSIKGKKRDRDREILQEAFDKCEKGEDGFTVTIGAMADYLDNTKAHVKRLIKEYGGYAIEQDGTVIFNGEVQDQEVKALLPEGIFADKEDQGE